MNEDSLRSYQLSKGSRSAVYIQGDLARSHSPQIHSASTEGGFSVEKSYFEDDKKKTIWGLSPLVFYIFIGFLLLLVGGAIGGGVAFAVIRENKTNTSPKPSSTPILSSPLNSTSSTTPTMTPTSASSTPTLILPNGGTSCPSANGTTYLSTSTTNFTIFCAADIQPNPPNPSIDLNHGVYETSFDACMDLCAELNTNSTNVSDQGECIGATWAVDTMQCYLKGKGGLPANPDGQDLDSAFLNGYLGTI